MLAKHRAEQAGAVEAVFILPDGTVTECASSNIFIVKDGVLMTHRLTTGSWQVLYGTLPLK